MASPRSTVIRPCVDRLVLLLLVLSGECAGLTHTGKVFNYVTLLDLYKSSNYSTVDIIPLLNQSAAIDVLAQPELYSMTDFDEVSGQIELATSITFSWTDQIVLAVTGQPNSLVFKYGGPADSMLVGHDKIWTPKVVLDNSVNARASVGGSQFMCRYMLDTGMVTWSPKIIIRSACTPDVTYYPFDRQTCSFSFVAWRFTAAEILFHVTRPDWILSSLEENGEWRVVTTTSSTDVTNDQSYLRLSITIERRPLYFAFNILLPTLCLALLNLMVFWLPPESGERVGFAVTCFLSFVVLLDTIMSILPRTSSPMSYLCYYVVVMMVFSALVTALTVLQLRVIHNKADQRAPRIMQVLSRLCTCKKSNKSGGSGNGNGSGGGCGDGSRARGSKTQVVPVVMANVKDHEFIGDSREWSPPDTPRSTSSLDQSTSEEKSADEVTWSDVSGLLDKLFFFGFLAAQIFFSVSFLLPVAYRIGL